MGLGFGLCVSEMDREAEVGLAENKRLDEGSLGLRVKAGLGGTVGLRGWLLGVGLGELTSEALDQLTSHLPLGPRNSLK